MSELASKAIDAIAAVRAIDTSGTEHPMRHNVRTLKQQAEQVLSEAFNTAHALAELASTMVSDHDKAVQQHSRQDPTK